MHLSSQNGMTALNIDRCYTLLNDVKSVHQLQILYYALTELELNLL